MSRILLTRVLGLNVGYPTGLLAWRNASAVRSLAVLLTGSALMLVGAVACVTAPSADAPSAGEPPPTCGTLGPSTDPDAIARVGVMFSRPENVTQLLQNLKLAYDKNLFIQPAFYSDANLLKFFAGVEVTWSEPRPLNSADTSAREIEVTVDGHVLPHLTVQISRACTPVDKYLAPGHYRVDHITDGARVELHLDMVPGFTLGATRAIFGTETSGGLERPTVIDEPYGSTYVVPKEKGILIYEGQGEPPASRDQATFLVRSDPKETGLGAQRLNDTDSIQGVTILQWGR